ncbi:DUF397 domain-containing protein [Streptomyces sp. F63]|uniref:DUF397 domain-containing protein n=1 Tax=Streptomyces sp. F63 TaxID=2824887 RepID=UPI001B36A509|nr:DUF397 domain-containing protein [Streptomyces sp. F63]MBQ0984890.1 DUF397 domain-containing protein [Streptomyces sp. F63]
MNDAPTTWFKSSYSGDEGGDCLEVAYSGGRSMLTPAQDNACSEGATGPSAVHIRDSKHRSGPTLTIAPTAWAAFTASLS